MKTLNDDDLKEKLTPQQYQVLRQKATEMPFSGELLYNHDKGVYVCGACGQPLFSSDTKFESGSGWPSFYDAVSKTAVKLPEDDSHGMQRTEIICGNCGSHLGHVFDEPSYTPTGKYYCVNSAALDFKKKPQ